MSPVSWAVVVLLALFVPFIPVFVRPVWRGTHPYLHRGVPPGWWVFGARAWRGFRRSLIVLPLVYVAMLAAVVAGGLTPRHSSLAWITTALAFLFLVGGALMVWLALFARPRALVPPALRSERGPVADWRARRSSARATR